MADALLRKMSGARERQSGRRIRFIFCAFILLAVFQEMHRTILYLKSSRNFKQPASVGFLPL